MKKRAESEVASQDSLFINNCPFFKESFDSQHKLFNQIDLLLRCNQNVALYGYGSKFKLVESFLKEKGADHPIAVFYGFSGTISLAGILSSLEKSIKDWRKFTDNMDIEYPKTARTSRLSAVIENLKKNFNQVRLYVVVHNIDGKNIIDEQTQLALSELAKIDQVFPFLNSGKERIGFVSGFIRQCEVLIVDAFTNPKEFQLRLPQFQHLPCLPMGAGVEGEFDHLQGR